MKDFNIGMLIGYLLGSITTVLILGAFLYGRGLQEGRCLERGGQLVEGKCSKVEVIP